MSECIVCHVYIYIPYAGVVAFLNYTEYSISWRSKKDSGGFLMYSVFKC